jgi:hypothetical protein
MNHDEQDEALPSTIVRIAAVTKKIEHQMPTPVGRTLAKMASDAISRVKTTTAKTIWTIAKMSVGLFGNVERQLLFMLGSDTEA